VPGRQRDDKIAMKPRRCGRRHDRPPFEEHAKAVKARVRKGCVAPPALRIELTQPRNRVHDHGAKA
jgi:hypothetical protein